jgi:hypothetical protein
MECVREEGWNPEYWGSRTSRQLFIFTAMRINIKMWLFQVDANAFSVEFSNVSFNINYAQSVADIRAVARVVARSVPSAQLIWRLCENSSLLVLKLFTFHTALWHYCRMTNSQYISKFRETCVWAAMCVHIHNCDRWLTFRYSGGGGTDWGVVGLLQSSC